MSTPRVRSLFTAYGVIVILAGLFCLGFAVVDSLGVGCGYELMDDGSPVDPGCRGDGMDWALVSLGVLLMAAGAGGLLLTRRVTTIPLPMGKRTP